MNFEVVFLLILALVWLVFATVQDIKKREIANWLNFSLVVFALGFRFFYSLFSIDSGFGFFYQGLIGLGIFFVLGHLFYYGKLFAGGDAKLMISLGTILPFHESFSKNLEIFMLFIVIFLVTGFIYGLIISIGMSMKNHVKFKKEFRKQFWKYRVIALSATSFSILLMVFGFFVDILFIYLGFLFFLLPYLFIHAKAVDESCMVKKIKTKELTEGDWLYKDVKIGKERIKAKWDGLGKEEIRKIRKNYETIAIRYGMPFSPVFLISFLIMVWIYFKVF